MTKQEITDETVSRRNNLRKILKTQREFWGESYKRVFAHRADSDNRELDYLESLVTLLGLP